ncbi:NADH-quinone oxidoreductase subunit N [Flavobacterium silvaticum]|uniref:NADH-quinone oxidoreductase subunit N n=1 Tax=Flavobacterium silvaticum TaxID=1852020 RepID=A0A972FME7_9FLAO|nr:NADH-quinone oxidoreductase subunit N [Flavobacterium silvaticum]NMH28696.1 NADH-quinone oxidoreductase subunit N [Flavobacterium silvaticum]
MNTLLIITGLGVLCLLLEILNFRKGIVPFTVVGLLVALGVTMNDYGLQKGFYGNMIVVNNFSVAFSSIFIVLAILLISMSDDFYRREHAKISDFVAIKVFMLAGAVAMVSFGNLSMFFLGIEVLSISLYILAASNRMNVRSNEAGMKYFLLGSFASGIILFGICLIYGAMGTFDIAEISELSSSAELPDWFFIGIVLLTIGMLFKIAAVPFHFWAPDVYEGSPALTTSIMSTLAKIVAIATFYKLLTGMNAQLSVAYEWVLLSVSIASMTLGNIMALRQENVKRMLAFSGIAHAGYMLMAFLNLANSASVLWYYAAAYALAGVAAFAVVLNVCRDKQDENIYNFNGFGKKHPVMAALLTGALLSMAGIPVFAGFFAKFGLFMHAINAGYLVVVIAAVINSIISVGYYFKLILAMYTKDALDPVENPKPIYVVVAAIALLLNLAMGLFPSLVNNLI